MSEPQTDEKKLHGIKGKYVLYGCDSDMKYLIYHNDRVAEGEIIVYVDKDLDLDWECDDKAQEIIDTPPLRASVRKILNDVASLEPIAHNWPSDLKLTSKRLLGESLASVLCNDIDGAEGAMEHAKNFISAKSKQVSRYWTLQGCLVAGGVAAVLGIIEILARTHLIEILGRTTFLMSLCFLAGCIGALLFVLMRFGTKQSIDSTAERHLHYLEALSRIVGGGLSGTLVGGMVKLGLIMPVFGKTGLESLAMFLAAMIAGASERLAAGIVTKTENNETQKKENQNGNN